MPTLVLTASLIYSSAAQRLPARGKAPATLPALVSNAPKPTIAALPAMSTPELAVPAASNTSSTEKVSGVGSAIGKAADGQPPSGDLSGWLGSTLFCILKVASSHGLLGPVLSQLFERLGRYIIGL